VKIQPLHDMVLVEVEEPETPQGIIIQTETQHVCPARIIEVGERVRFTSVGQRVLVNTLLGQAIGEQLLVPESAIQAIL